MPTDDSTPADEDAEGDVADATRDVEPDVPRAPDFTDDEPGLLEELTGRTPEAPDFDSGFGSADAEVDADLAREFWTIVVLLNVALFGMALGLLLVSFERRFRLGGAIFAVGAVALARGWNRYRAVRKD